MWMFAILVCSFAFGAVLLGTLGPQDVEGPSLQVFDIDNLTRSEEYKYLAKGTTDQLKSRLHKVDGLRVFGVHTTRSQMPQAKAGRFSLDGSLQAHQGKIRLTMQLSDDENGGDLLWSEDFNAEAIEDPLKLQTDIAVKTVTAIQSRMWLGP
jgi:TolB-like protein